MTNKSSHSAQRATDGEGQRGRVGGVTVVITRQKIDNGTVPWSVDVTMSGTEKTHGEALRSAERQVQGIIDEMFAQLETKLRAGGLM